MITIADPKEPRSDSYVTQSSEENVAGSNPFGFKQKQYNNKLHLPRLSCVSIILDICSVFMYVAINVGRVLILT